MRRSRVLSRLPSWNAQRPNRLQTLEIVDRNESSTATVRVTFNANSTTHTKGSWTEIEASTVAEGNCLVIGPDGVAVDGANTSMLLDIGFGAAASEVVVIPDIEVGAVTTAGGTSLIFPIRVPKGTRIAARTQAAITSDGIGLSIAVGRLTNFTAPARVLTFGTNAANSKGTSLTAPGSLNTKGAWTEITAAVSEPLHAIVYSASLDGQSTTGTCVYAIDIGVGSAGNEQVVASGLPGRTGGTEAFSLFYNNSGFGLPSMPVACDIPKGARLVARYQRSAAFSISLTVHGIPYS